MLHELFSVGFFIIAVTLVCTAVVAWTRVESPAVDLFAVAVAVLGAGSLIISAGFVMNSSVFVLGSTIAVAMIIPIPWIFFSFEYVGQEELISWSTASALSVPVMLGLSATIAVFAGQMLPWFTFFEQAGESGLAAVFITGVELIQWGGILYAGGVIVAGTGLILWSFQRYTHLDSTTGTVLCTFGTVPWVSVLFALQLQSVSFAVFSGMVAIGFGTGAVAAVALVGPTSLFNRVPAAGSVGPSAVIEELNDAVVITDGEGEVIELNYTARKLFGSQQETAGVHITTLLGKSLTDLRGSTPIEIETDSRQDLFDPTVSEITDQHDHLLGYAVLLRDITETTIRKQRVEVFNRLMRHNLRNDISVVLGQLSVVQEHADDPAIADNLEMIGETGRELVALSDKIRELEQLLSVDTETPQSIHLRSLVAQVVENLDIEQEAEFQYQGKDQVSLAATPDQLRAALENLITNAIEHNNDDRPEVKVRVRRNPGASYPVEIAVLDNGPGIPEQERQAMTTGEETPLVHSSGIGLWTVHWIVRSLGGKLSFDSREPQGTVVRLQLPSRGHQRPVA